MTALANLRTALTQAANEPDDAVAIPLGVNATVRFTGLTWGDLRTVASLAEGPGHRAVATAAPRVGDSGTGVNGALENSRWDARSLADKYAQDRDRWRAEAERMRAVLENLVTQADTVRTCGCEEEECQRERAMFEAEIRSALLALENAR